MVAVIRRFIVALLVATFTVTAGNAQQAQAATGTCKQYHDALRRAGLPVVPFSAIMWRESRCVPGAIGWNYQPGTGPHSCKRAVATIYKRCRAVKTYDSGLLQINSSWVTVTAKVCRSTYGDMTVLLQPKCNLAVAAHLYKTSGIGNWRASSGSK